MKCLVIGVGNRFRSDDAIGPEVVSALRNRGLPSDISIVEVGMDGLGLIEHLGRAERVVIVDAVSAGEPPGTIMTFSPDNVGMLMKAGRTAIHGFGLADALALAGTMGVSPKITIVGVQPLSTELGESLSPPVASKLPAIVRAVLQAAGKAG